MTVTATLPERRTRYGLAHVLRSEFTKLRTLRSTGWTLLVAVVGTIGVTVLVTNSAAHHNHGWYQGSGFDPTNQSLTGLLLALLVLGVFGVLAATGEYATGTIRSSLAATPRRPLFLLAKVLVVGAVALVVGEVVSFAAFGVGQAIFASGTAPTASLAQPGVLRAVMLSGAFLALIALSGLALGVIFRHTAGALSVFLGLTFLLPLIMSRLSNHSIRFTPIPILSNSVSAVVPQSNAVTAPEGFALMALYTVALLGLATAVLLRRDA